MVSQKIYTVPSLPADDISMAIVDHITSMQHQKARRREAWAVQTMHGRTRLSSLSDSRCALRHHRILVSEIPDQYSRLWWASPPRCYRCIRFPMHGIALHLPTSRKHGRKRVHLETNGVLRFMRASPSSSGIKGTKNLRRSMHVGVFGQLENTQIETIEYIQFSLCFVVDRRDY